ncbi:MULTISPECIES: DUF494 family protein [Calditerrivibrio]|uniref:DUF494 family protein n=1 Tax=Calditerrivibrio TaxID=545865 RepID=UPI003C732EBF
MDKIFIAINIIIDYIDNTKKLDETEFTNQLIDIGFGDHEIRQAMSIFEIQNFSGNPIYRTFTKKEISKLSNETMLFIQKLYLYGILEAELIEESIEKAIESSQQKVSIENYKNALLFTLMEARNLYFEQFETEEDFS